MDALTLFIDRDVSTEFFPHHAFDDTLDSVVKEDPRYQAVAAKPSSSATTGRLVSVYNHIGFEKLYLLFLYFCEHGQGDVSMRWISYKMKKRLGQIGGVTQSIQYMDAEWRNPLMMACIGRNLSVVTVLTRGYGILPEDLLFKVQMTQTDIKRRTALMHACNGPNQLKEIVEILIHSDCSDLCACDINGDTPLHYAVKSVHCNIEIVDMLITRLVFDSHSAWADAINATGMSPFGCAIKCAAQTKCNDVVALFLKHKEEANIDIKLSRVDVNGDGLLDYVLLDEEVSLRLASMLQDAGVGIHADSGFDVFM